MENKYCYMVFDRLSDRVVCFCDSLNSAIDECKKVVGRCAVVLPVPSSAAEWYETSAE